MTKSAMGIFALLSFALLSFALAGCAVEDETCLRDSVCIDATIADDPSRTAMSGSMASFTVNDKIGLFEALTGQANVAYTYNGLAWSASPPAYWADGVSTHTFYAYYPYVAASSGAKVAVPVLSMQTVGTTPASSFDFLVSGPRTLTRRAGVDLAFAHKFALLQFNVKLGVLGLLNPYNFNSITINAGNVSTSASPYGIVNTTSGLTYDLVSGTFQAASNSAAYYTQRFTGTIDRVTVLYTAVTIYVLVLPGTYSAPTPTVSFNLSLLGVLNPRDTTPVSLPNTTFQSGSKYTYNVTITGSLFAASKPPVILISQ